MDRDVITRHLEFKRGSGLAGNNAAPIITMEMKNGSGGLLNRGDVVVVSAATSVAGTLQKETATITGTITTAGNATIIVTAAAMTGSPITFSVPVLVNDTATIVAGKVASRLRANVAVTELFTVTTTGTTVVLTSKYPFANDATLNVSSDNDTCAGLSTAANSANTTAGVAASGGTADIMGCTTTASGDNRAAIGIVYDNVIYPGMIGKILIWGPTSALKADGTSDIAIGDYLSTFTTAKIAQKSTGVGAFAMALEAYTANDSSGVIDAFILTMGIVPRPPS